MNNYFRITGYSQENDFCFIIDSNGKFEKLWQFSAYLVSKGLKILEVNKLENIIDINIEKVKEDSKHIFLRAITESKLEYVDYKINDITYKAIKVAEKLYIVK